MDKTKHQGPEPQSTGLRKAELQQTILSRYDSVARRYRASPATGEHIAPDAAPTTDEQSALIAGESGLGCARLSALVQLFPGENLLDVGSGPGLETIALARLVRPGLAYGLDALPSMVEVARGNTRRAGVENVMFLTGPMEAIPLEDASVDVVVSNCVINLSQEKDCVMGEIMRVLRPGGRLAIADLVWLGSTPTWARNSATAWACCLGGALEATEFPELLGKAGFTDVDVRVLWTLDPAALSGCGSAGSPGSCCGPAVEPECCSGTAGRAGSLCSHTHVTESGGEHILASAFVTARKPATGHNPAAGTDAHLAAIGIREATSEDLDLVLRILQAAGLPTAGVAEHLPSFLLAHAQNGTVVGLVGLERHPGSAALLRSLVVLPSRRGRGLGRRLVTSQIARLDPHTPVYLLTTSAEGYFRRLGFQAVAREEAPTEIQASAEFRSACPKTATLMRLADLRLA